MTNADSYRNDLDFARRMDREDPLAPFRDKFHIPGPSDNEQEIYLCGNSLGLQPKSVADYVAAELDKWRCLGVKGHFEGEFPWLPYHEFLAEAMAEVAKEN